MGPDDLGTGSAGPSPGWLGSWAGSWELRRRATVDAPEAGPQGPRGEHANECRGGALYKYPNAKEVKTVAFSAYVLLVAAALAIRVISRWALF